MTKARQWYAVATALLVAAVLVDAGHNLTISVLLIIAAIFAAVCGLGWAVEPSDHRNPLHKDKDNQP